MAPTDDFDIRGVDYILNIINDQNAQMAKDNNTFVQEIIKGFGDVKDEAKLSNKAMDAKTNAIIDYLKKYDAATDKLIEYIKESNQTLQEFKKETGKPVSSDIFATAMTDVLGRAHQQSTYAASHGGTPLIAYGSKNKDFEDKMKDLVTNQQLDKSTEKLIAFFAGAEAAKEEKAKKDKRRFIDDFIEELGKSKFIKGTFFDTIKLLAYVAGSWLSKHFGVFGRGVAIALLAAAPAIATLLGKAIGGAITKALGALGNFIGSKILGALGRGIARSGMSMGLAGGSKAAMVAGGALGATSIGLGALFGTEAADSFKKKRYGEGGILAGSAIAAVLGGIGVLFGVAFAPVVAGVGVVVGLLTLLNKKFKIWDKIVDYFKSILEKLGIIAKDKEAPDSPYRSLNTGEKIRDYLDTSMKLHDEVRKHGGVTPEDIRKSNATEYALNKQNMVKNVGEMTQQRAFSEFGRYEKEHPEAFNQGYIRISKNDPNARFVDFSQFRTDVAGKYENGIPTEVILPRAIFERYKKQKLYAEGRGMSKSSGRITSGIMSAGSEIINPSTGLGYINPHRSKDHIWSAIDTDYTEEEYNRLKSIIKEGNEAGENLGPYASIYERGSGTTKGHAHEVAKSVAKDIVPVIKTEEDKSEAEKKQKEDVAKAETNKETPTFKEIMTNPEAKRKFMSAGTNTDIFAPGNVTFSKCLQEAQSASIFGLTDAARI